MRKKFAFICLIIFGFRNTILASPISWRYYDWVFMIGESEFGIYSWSGADTYLAYGSVDHIHIPVQFQVFVASVSAFFILSIAFIVSYYIFLNKSNQ